MKANFIIPIISAVLLGYLCANYVIKESKVESVNTSNTVYFLQISASNNEDNNEFKDIKNKLTIKEDKYYTYIGMTLDKDTALNIKKIYSDNNVDVYIKSKIINNNRFISELEQYDILLKNSKTKEEIDNILKTILSSYEEILNNL